MLKYSTTNQFDIFILKVTNLTSTYVQSIPKKLFNFFLFNFSNLSLFFVFVLFLQWLILTFFLLDSYVRNCKKDILAEIQEVSRHNKKKKPTVISL